MKNNFEIVLENKTISMFIDEKLQYGFFEKLQKDKFINLERFDKTVKVILNTKYIIQINKLSGNNQFIDRAQLNESEGK